MNVWTYRGKPIKTLSIETLKEASNAAERLLTGTFKMPGSNMLHYFNACIAIDAELADRGERL